VGAHLLLLLLASLFLPEVMDVEEVVYVFGQLGLRVGRQRSMQGPAPSGGGRDGNASAQEAYLDGGLLLVFAAEEPADAVHGEVKDGRGGFMGLPWQRLERREEGRRAVFGQRVVAAVRSQAAREGGEGKLQRRGLASMAFAVL
jgi:hypothetical protein